MLQSSGPKKNPSVLFLLLIFIAGALIGAIIMYFTHTNQNTNKNFAKEKSAPVYSQNTENQIAQQEKIVQEKPVVKHENTETSSAESTSVESDPKQIAPDTVAVINNNKPVTIQPVIDRDEYVAKDEMIAERFVQIQIPLKRDVSLDSILINDKTRQEENLLHVEFWRSPINYTGYQYRKNKLVLFGFYEPDLLKLRMQNEKLAVFYKDNVFLLEETEYFKPLILKRKK